MPRDADGLTARQARFVDELLADLKADGKAAAIRAGASPKRAHATACEWLKDPRVQAVIARKRARLANKLELTAEGVLRDLAADRELARSLEQMGPAVRASELLGKHLGLWKDRVELTGKAEGPIQIVEVVRGEVTEVEIVRSDSEGATA
jgi:phage terminase small subunit